MPTGYRALFDDLKSVAITEEQADFMTGKTKLIIAIQRHLATILQQLTDLALAYPLHRSSKIFQMLIGCTSTQLLSFTAC